MEEVSEGVNDIRLAELVLYEGHDLWDVLFAGVASELYGHDR
jgi:hypothetical protein